MRIDLQRETKIRRQTFADIVPGIAGVVASINAPVMLQEHARWRRRMAHDFVHALAPLGMLLVGWHERRADALVARLPILTAIVGAVDAARGNGDKHSLRICRIRKNRMKTKPAASRLPLWTVRMIEQALIQNPGFTAIRRFKKRRRLDSTVQTVRVMRIVDDLPNLLQRNFRAFRKLDVVTLRIAPALAKVVRRTQE